MKIEPKNNCPLNNFEPCKQMDCAWFVKIGGNHPQTDEYVEEWACAHAWLPILMIENNLKQIQTGAAIESFRNEMVRSNDRSAQMLMEAATIKNKLGM